MTGPFESEPEARAAAHAVVPPAAGSSILDAAGNRQLLGRALEEAGVQTGRYDDRIAEWLAGWEDAICAVIAGWISRARTGGSSLTGEQRQLVLTALDDAIARCGDFDYCDDCETYTAGRRCGPCTTRLARIPEYSALRAQLAGDR
jgi:hypothetical protein